MDPSGLTLQGSLRTSTEVPAPVPAPKASLMYSTVATVDSGAPGAPEDETLGRTVPAPLGTLAAASLATGPAIAAAVGTPAPSESPLSPFAAPNFSPFQGSADSSLGPTFASGTTLGYNYIV